MYILCQGWWCVLGNLHILANSKVEISVVMTTNKEVIVCESPLKHYGQNLLF